MQFKTYFREWTATTLDIYGQPSNWEKDYGNGLAGTVARNGVWVLYLIDGPNINSGMETGPTDAFAVADFVAASPGTTALVADWYARPIEKPKGRGHQSYLRIQEYRRPQ